MGQKKDDQYIEFRRTDHLYEVYNADGDRVLFTDYPEAVDDPETINSRIKAGYKFKISGKNIPKTKILNEAKKIRK